MAILAVRAFVAGRRVLYATPTQDQVDAFWFEVKAALSAGIDTGALYKNESSHMIERAGTKNRVRAKTAWNADTLRGDYADLLILDEYQLMSEDAWGVVGAPMLLDNDGDAVFVYTPPSIRSAVGSKAHDKRHAAKLFRRAAADTTGRWVTFHFGSHSNPYLSPVALAELTQDITQASIRQEIDAIDTEDVPGALWKAEQLDALRVSKVPDLVRIVVAVDPSVTSGAGSDEAGIVVAGIDANHHGYVLEDASLRGSPHTWASAAVALYNKYRADMMVAEANQGGDMVALTIGTIPGAPFVRLIHASRGKVVRAEPIASYYENGLVHHVGYFPELEGELTTYVAGGNSPNRLDAMVYALTELKLGNRILYAM